MHRFSSYILTLPLAALALIAGEGRSYAEPMPVAAMPVAVVAAEKIAPPEKADDSADDTADDETPAPAPAPAAPPASAVVVTPAVPASAPAAPVAVTTTPAAAKSASKVVLPVRRPGDIVHGDDEELPVVDTDENIPLPPYPANARTTIGALQTYSMGEEDSLLDVARYFKLGFVELRAANPKVDPWTPVPGEPVVIPAFKLLPRAEQKGIVVNLAQMRLYYFKTPGKEPVTFPIGIGREGLLTPTGQTTIVRKVAGPTWFPTPRMREEKPYLPAAIPPGPSNPLGTHAFYLGWPEFRIHGTDKPWAIGRRVSSGCMRMYPEDISALFKMVPVGTKVTVVEQPILVGWVGDQLYLEANPSKSQSGDIEISGEHEIKGLTDGLKKVITDAAGVPAERIDWDAVKQAVEERLGSPVVIAGPKPVDAPVVPAPKQQHPMFKGSSVTKYNYNR